MDISVHEFWGQRAIVDPPSPTEAAEPTGRHWVGPARARVPKRKRPEESLHDLGPCDSCRARRVKCLRDDPVDTACADCRRRHTECVSVGGSVNKAWARIAQPPKTGEAPLAVENGSPTALSASPSELSAEARVRIAEENSAILSSLLYTFYELASQGFGVLWWPTLRDLFERAGRNLHRLEPAIQIQLLTCMGFAAMVTDHPLVLGSDEPVSAGARSGHDSPSRQRTLFLDKLREQLLDLADRRALHRTENLVDAAVLAFLGKWCSYVGHASDRDPLYAASFSSIGRLVGKPVAASFTIGCPIEWIVAFEDAVWSLREGSALHFDDEAIEDILEQASGYTPSLERVPEIVTSSAHQHYLSIAVYWGPLILQTRQIAKSVSRPLKRGKAVSLATWADMVRSHHAFCSLALRAHLDAVRLDIAVSPRAHAAQVKSFGSTAAAHLESLVFAYLGCTAILFQKFKEWAGAQLSQIAPSPGFVASCGAVGRTLEHAFVEGLLVLVRRLQLPGMMTLKVLATDFAGLSLSARLLDLLLEVTIDLPHAEVGGHPSFPLRVKLEAADLLVRGLQVQSWAYPDKRPALVKGQAGLDRLRAAACPARPPSSSPRPPPSDDPVADPASSEPAPTPLTPSTDGVDDWLRDDLFIA